MKGRAPLRALGIVGSPRKGGNTDILTDEALRGASEAGALTEKVYLVDLDIAPCDGCETCLTSGACVHDDDIDALLEKMR
jgi:multimeric flavodoxin WrbA